VLLLTDWIVRDGDWSFLRELTRAGYSCQVVGVEITRRYASRIKRVLFLWSGYFLLGLKGYLKSDGNDVVIAYQGVAGLFYGWLQLLWRRPAKLVLMAFFFKRRRNRLYNAARWFFTKQALRGVDLVVSYSRQESEHYNRLFRCRERKFVFVPFGINCTRLAGLSLPPEEGGNYIFSSGCSNRDYGVLFEAVRGLAVRCVVIAKKYNTRGLRIPPNVDVEYDVYDDRYYEAMRKAMFVVIPLEDPEVSSGQMVLLEAMAMGKAVIATRTFGTEDYVQDGEDGLLVPPGDSNSLREKIHYLLQNPGETERLGRNAQAKALSQFSVTQLVEGVSSIIEKEFA
jgi:glycosyltransferase involved in cell wall biosynthesis